MVITALQLGLLFARLTPEQKLNIRRLYAINWSNGSMCGRHIHSKKYRSRQRQTLVGQDRLNAKSRTLSQSKSVLLNQALGIAPYQSSSEELMCLGCLMNVSSTEEFRMRKGWDTYSQYVVPLPLNHIH